MLPHQTLLIIWSVDFLNSGSECLFQNICFFTDEYIFVILHNGYFILADIILEISFHKIYVYGQSNRQTEGLQK